LKNTRLGSDICYEIVKKVGLYNSIGINGNKCISCSAYNF
jgi:hypothetical protein